jgi:UDP-N-acetylmuramate: L-alanyl-gamma-D-glutamyl-meso-diaminopimelate ligase
VYIPAVPDIVAFLLRETRKDDVILVMSNGIFGGVHDRLLEALRARG